MAVLWLCCGCAVADRCLQSDAASVVCRYDLLDATGQMCWDENRDYGAKYGSGVYAVAMRDMVKRDRNHASVIMWSFCNEAECTQYGSPAPCRPVPAVPPYPSPYCRRSVISCS